LKRQAILVTGGAGFIGSWLCERLLALRHDVTALDNLSTGCLENIPSGARKVIVDLATDDLDPAFSEFRPKTVIHCAGRVSVIASMEGPERDLRDNLQATLKLLQACRRHEVERIVFLSSGAGIYGERESPADEDAPIRPISIYGVNKYAAERYCALSGIPWLSMRLSNVYGPRQRHDTESGVVAIFMDHIRRGKLIDIFGSGNQIRDFTYVSDVVEATTTALEADLHGVFNVSLGRTHSVNELIGLLAELTDTTIETNQRPSKTEEIVNSRLSSRKLQLATRWRPKIGLREGLRLCLRDLSLLPGEVSPNR
jgi:UDP-glucose 4-epimerase